MQDEVYGVLRGMAEALPNHELEALSIALTDMHGEAIEAGDRRTVALANLLALPMEQVMSERLYGYKSAYQQMWWDKAWEGVDMRD